MISISVTDTDPNTISCYGQDFVPNHPSPKSPLDFGQAFCSIMFSFSGASTFPTIQTDMKNREKFPAAAVFGMLSKNQQFYSERLKCLPLNPSLLLDLPPDVGDGLVVPRGQGGGECRVLAV